MLYCCHLSSFSVLKRKNQTEPKHTTNQDIQNEILPFKNKTLPLILSLEYFFCIITLYEELWKLE